MGAGDDEIVSVAVGCPLQSLAAPALVLAGVAVGVVVRAVAGVMVAEVVVCPAWGLAVDGYEAHTCGCHLQ